MKKTLSLILVIVMLSTLLVGCGNSNVTNSTEESENAEKGKSEKISWSIGTSGSGSGAYLTGGIISGVINEAQDLVILSPQVTAGFQENPVLVNSGQANLGMILENDLPNAFLGKGQYKEPNPNLRRLFTYNIYIGHFIALPESNINSLYDIKGKKVNIGVPAQATRDLNNILLEVMDIDFKDFTVFELSTGDALSAIQDKTIDATLNLGTLGQASLLELSNSIPIKFIDMPDDLFEKFNAAAGNVLLPDEIPANTYKNQTEPVKSWAVGSTLVTSVDADEDIIYAITKAFWENLDVLTKEAAFKGLEMEKHALVETVVPIHPGAERYFKEVGLI